MNATPDLIALKTRQQVALGTGDCAVVGTTLQIVGELLAEACDLKTDERVLDVAAGNGNATLAAARRRRGSALRRRQLRRRHLDLRCHVLARPVPSGGRNGARVPARRPHRVGELEAGQSDRTPVQGAGPLCTPAGGRAVAGTVGTEAHVRSLFGERVTQLKADPLVFNFRYRSATHFVDVFRAWYGPMNKAFAAQSPEQAEALAGELTTLLDSLNRAPGSLVVPSEYLEIVVTCRCGSP